MLLEILLDPAVFAVGATVVGAVGLKSVERMSEFFDERIKEEKAKIVIPEKPVEPIEDCVYLEHRKLEQVTVDSGELLPEDCLTCEVEGCKNCEPIKQMRQDKYRLSLRGLSYTAPSKNVVFVEPKRPKNIYQVPPERKVRPDTKPADTAPDFQKFQWLKRNDPRYKNYRFEDYEFQQKLRRQQEKRQAEAVKIENMSRKAVSLNLKQKSSPKRTLHLKNGVELVRPDGVPSFAVPRPISTMSKPMSYNDTYYKIVWSWDYNDGKSYSRTQKVSRKVYEAIKALSQKEDSWSYEVRTDHDHVVKFWSAVNDPVTGEHLGDYRKVKGEVALRNVLDNCNCAKCDESVDYHDVESVKKFLHTMKEFDKSVHALEQRAKEIS